MNLPIEHALAISALLGFMLGLITAPLFGAMIDEADKKDEEESQ